MSDYVGLCQCPLWGDLKIALAICGSYGSFFEKGSIHADLNEGKAASDNCANDLG